MSQSFRPVKEIWNMHSSCFIHRAGNSAQRQGPRRLSVHLQGQTALLPQPDILSDWRIQKSSPTGWLLVKEFSPKHPILSVTNPPSHGHISVEEEFWKAEPAGQTRISDPPGAGVPSRQAQYGLR
jgi:hypothetical protein